MSGFDVARRSRDRGGRRGTSPLALQPLVDVGLSKAPLPPDTQGGQLPGLDQAVNGSQVDLKVLENLLRGEEDVVHVRPWRLL